MWGGTNSFLLFFKLVV